MRNRIAIFPGSFDPFTKGHADIVERGLKLFDEIYIAVGHNPQKPGWMPVEMRKDSIRAVYKDNPRIHVADYTILTADFAKEIGAEFILRGVRTAKDYEYELQMADINRQLTGAETVVLFADPKLASLSSSIVRELDHFGHDIEEFLPQL